MPPAHLFHHGRCNVKAYNASSLKLTWMLVIWYRLFVWPGEQCLEMGCIISEQYMLLSATSTDWSQWCHLLLWLLYAVYITKLGLGKPPIMWRVCTSLSSSALSLCTLLTLYNTCGYTHPGYQPPVAYLHIYQHLKQWVQVQVIYLDNLHPHLHPGQSLMVDHVKIIVATMMLIWSVNTMSS